MAPIQQPIRNLLELLIPIRIDDNGQFTKEELLQFLKDNPHIVLVKEYGDFNTKYNPHYHGWTFKDNIPMITLRKKINNQLHCKGNGDYSFKKDKKTYQTVDGYYRYVCKGLIDLPPQEYHNITEDEINDYHQRYWEENKRINQTKNKQPETFKEELLSYIKKDGYTDSTDLLSKVILYFRTKQKLFSESDAQRYFLYIRNEMEPNFNKILSNRLIEKWNY